MKKHAWILLPMALLLIGAVGCKGSETTVRTLDNDLAILYTNDVHCAVGDEETLGYSELAKCKKNFLEDGNYVAVVDSGDAIQGAPIGTLSKGLYITDIMEEVGYDVAIPGNHEFDYGMENFLTLSKNTSFPYVCSNFMDLKTNETVFDPYVIKQYDDMKVAFLGITTPKTITSSSPKYFQDDNGNFIYGFCQDSGDTLYSAVQKAVDSAKKEGADYVVAMSHLGTGTDTAPFMSTDVIENTNGIDVMLDGHSHSVIDCQRVKNKDGKTIILSSTGTKFESFGVLYITKEGNISTGLEKDYATRDSGVSDYIASVQAQFNDKLTEKVAYTNYDLSISDPETGKRIVRKMETNIGDLCADAFRVSTGADIAIVNSGGVRANIKTGDITYGDIISVMPFNNTVCEIKAKGSAIAQALEMSCRLLPGESGGFMQVSGISFEVDSGVSTPVVLDANGLFVSLTDGARRVSNIKVGSEKLDETKTYTLTSTSYTLKSNGDGYTMFDGAEIVSEEFGLDNQVLINYIQDNLGGVVGDDYKNIYGENRIVDITEK